MKLIMFGVDDKEVPYAKELAEMPNVVVTPHVAFMTTTAVRNMVQVSLNDIAAIIEGKNVKNEVRF